MIVLSAEAIRKHYGPEPVLDGVTFEIHPGERIGLVGPNGTGKTTLLKILAGKEDADGGHFELHPSAAVGYLEQQPIIEPGRTLWQEALSALATLIAYQHESEQVARALAANTDEVEHRRLAARFDFLQQELQRHDAYNLDHKIERVLEGLGLRRQSFSLPVESLSGGEQNRLMLAKLLLAEPDLMLLDEPSNHLDIQATEWLEEFLCETRAAILLVSHDRYFLDRVTNRTFELFHGTVEAYTGNFSAYWQQKAERLLVQTRTYVKQQEEIDKTKDFIRRNAYGQKHAAGGRPPQEAAAAGRGPGRAAAGDRRSGDGVSRGQPQRRPGAAGGKACQGLRPPAVRRRFPGHPSRSAMGRAGTNGCGQDHVGEVPLGPTGCGRRRLPVGAGGQSRLLRSASRLAPRGRPGGRRHSTRPQGFQRAETTRSLGPLRRPGRYGLAAGGPAQRRRAMPGGPCPAGRLGRQFPRPRRAHQPSGPLGPGRAGAIAPRVRRNRALRQPRPLLCQPDRRSPDRGRAGPGSGRRGKLQRLPRPAPPRRVAAQLGQPRRPRRAPAPQTARASRDRRRLPKTRRDIVRRARLKQSRRESRPAGGTYRPSRRPPATATRPRAG